MHYGVDDRRLTAIDRNVSRSSVGWSVGLRSDRGYSHSSGTNRRIARPATDAPDYPTLKEALFRPLLSFPDSVDPVEFRSPECVVIWPGMQAEVACEIEKAVTWLVGAERNGDSRQ